MSTNCRWLTIRETAAFLSINPKTASAWCLTHRLPAARIGGRGPWRVDRLKLEADLESQTANNKLAAGSGRGVALGARPARALNEGHNERGG